MNRSLGVAALAVLPDAIVYDAADRDTQLEAPPADRLPTVCRPLLTHDTPPMPFTDRPAQPAYPVP